MAISNQIFQDLPGGGIDVERDPGMDWNCHPSIRAAMAKSRYPGLAEDPIYAW